MSESDGKAKYSWEETPAQIDLINEILRKDPTASRAYVFKTISSDLYNNLKKLNASSREEPFDDRNSLSEGNPKTRAHTLNHSIYRYGTELRGYSSFTGNAASTELYMRQSVYNSNTGALAATREKGIYDPNGRAISIDQTITSQPSTGTYYLKTRVQMRVEPYYGDLITVTKDTGSISYTNPYQ